MRWRAAPERAAAAAAAAPGGLRWLALLRRFLVVAAYAVWIGGLAFYGSVVIPIGTSVVGSHAVQGLVTQRVTWAVNLISLPALAILLWNLTAERRRAGGLRRNVLLGTWALMLVVQAALFLMHLELSGMLDPQAHAAAALLDRPRFDPLHEAYIRVTGVQHAAGLVHLWFVLLVWSDPAAPGPVGRGGSGTAGQEETSDETAAA